MNIMRRDPGKIFFVCHYIQLLPYADEFLSSQKDLLFNSTSLINVFIFLPIDLGAMHPAVIITFTCVVFVRIIIDMTGLISIKDHRYSTKEKTMCLHQ